MAEFIIRLTDEQEEFIRNWGSWISDSPTRDLIVQLADLNRDIRDQLRDALALYDQLVAEAKAKAADDE